MFVVCPHCGATLQLPSAGAPMVSCGTCRQAIRVQQAAAAPSDAKSRPPALPTKQPAVGQQEAPGFISVETGPSGKDRESKAATKRRASQWGGTLQLVQIVLGGFVGLAAAYGILQFLNIGPFARPQAVSTSPAKSRTPRPAEEPEVERPPANNRVLPPPERRTLENLARRSIPASPKTEKSNERDELPSTSAVPSTAPAAVSAPPKKPAPVATNWPSQAALPSLETVGEATLATASAAALAAIDLELRSEAADIAGAAPLYYLQADENGKGWDVLFTDDEKAEAPSQTQIARLKRNSGELTFQWLADAAQAPVATQLQNCVLVVKESGQKHPIQLRKSVSSSPLRIDADQEKQTAMHDLEKAPRQDAIFVEFHVSKAGKFDNGLGTAKLKKDVSFAFQDLNGAELLLQLDRRKPTDPFVITAETCFVESKTRYELTRPKLATMTKRWADAGKKTTVSLQQSQAAFNSAQSAIRSLGPKPASNGVAQAEWERSYLALVERAKHAAERVPNLQKKLAEMSARMNAVPQVEQFLNALHETPLPYTLYAQSGPYRIVLVDARQ
jgi:hypothetical protein